MKKLTGVLWACLLAVVANAQVYVSPTGAGAKDGSSWENAMDSVKLALPIARAAEVKEVWIAGGTYPAGDAWGTLNANMEGVTVYGGFNGEASPDARAKVLNGKAYEFVNPTMITADVGFAASVGKGLPCTLDGITWTKRTSNFSCRNNVIFRYCTWSENVHKGHILAPYMTDKGIDALPTILESCLFLNNHGNNGSNIIQHNGEPTSIFGLENCDFIGNKATHRIITSGGLLSVVNCRFFNNEPESGGGTVVNMNSNGQVVNSSFFNNTCTHNVITGAGQIINSTIVNNICNSAIILSAPAAPALPTRVYNTIVLGNTFPTTGESVGILGDVVAEVKNSAFSGTLGASVSVDKNMDFAPTFMPFTAPSTFVGSDLTKSAELNSTDWALTNKPHGLIDGGAKAYFEASFAADRKDLAGNTRVQNAEIDLGAYENANVAPALPTLTTVASAGGVIDPTLAAAPRRMGEAIALSATQDQGQEFVNWTNQAGTSVSETPGFTYEMLDADATLTANFQVAGKKFVLTVQAGTNGTVSSEGGEYNFGEKITLTATPNEDYKFAAWTDKDGKIISRVATFELTMERRDTLVTANFKYKMTRYLVSPNSVEGEGPASTWQRAAATGETIINLDQVMVDGVSTSMSLDEYVKNNLWPLPLSAGDEIWLLGSYFQTFEAIEITEGVHICGGFAGTETATSQRVRADLDGNGLVEPWEFENLSVLDGQMQTIDVKNSVLLLHADGIVVDGLVVQGGFQGAIDYGVGVNLGLRNDPVTGAIMRNSIIRNNLVSSNAGATAYFCGVVLWSKSLLEASLIENNMIDATNTGAAYSAGVGVSGGSLKDCVIRNNRNLAGGDGTVQGGGIKLVVGTVVNCVISNNVSVRGAGVYIGPNVGASMSYCTIVNNEGIASAGKTDNAVTGAGVYFRGLEGSAAGGVMQNCIAWNNKTPDMTKSNIFIEGNGRNGEVKLGANASNGGAILSDDTKKYYTPLGGNASSIADLPIVDVFNNPSAFVGFNPDENWEGDWSPKLSALGVASPLAEDEKDILGRLRSEGNGALGAFEFGSPLSINQGKVSLAPFVYSSLGQLRVSFFQPVTVEVFDITGMSVTKSTSAKTDHVFSLPKNVLYLVVVKSGDQVISKKVSVQ